MSKTGNTIIEGQKITKIFEIGTGPVSVLKEVDVTIKKGEFIILFGSSGCGKSTLLNILLGLETPTEGKVLFLDRDMYSYTEDERSQIRKEDVGLIYQQQNWVKSLNVLENVAFPLTLRGVLREEREKEALEMLKMVSLDNAFSQVPTELSSGQQQKVSFARALISKPILLVADEPTGNLDSKSSQELMEMFKAYNEEGNTIIMVTHDLKFLTYATRSLNMVDGSITGEYLKGDKELEKFKVVAKTNEGDKAQKTKKDV